MMVQGTTGGSVNPQQSRCGWTVIVVRKATIRLKEKKYIHTYLSNMN